MTSDCIALVGKQLLHQLKEVASKEETIPDELLRNLHAIFQETLKPALDLVDRGHVMQLKSPSGRSFYQVRGSSGVPYVVMETSNLCTCPSYVFSVLNSKDTLACKHALAVEIAVALDKCTQRIITDEDYGTFLAGDLISS